MERRDDCRGRHGLGHASLVSLPIGCTRRNRARVARHLRNSLDEERRIRRWEERLRANGSLSLDPDQVDRASAAGYVFFATF